MPDLLVVVLEVADGAVEAHLAVVDQPGEVLRSSRLPRSGELFRETAEVLGQLAAGDLADRLLGLAVAVAADVTRDDADALVHALGAELAPGWGLPAALPVVPGSAERWAVAAAAARTRPAVAGAVIAAARAVGAHAHLPRDADLPRDPDLPHTAQQA